MQAVGLNRLQNAKTQNFNQLNTKQQSFSEQKQTVNTLPGYKESIAFGIAKIEKQRNYAKSFKAATQEKTQNLLLDEICYEDKKIQKKFVLAKDKEGNTLFSKTLKTPDVALKFLDLVKYLDKPTQQKFIEANIKTVIEEKETKSGKSLKHPEIAQAFVPFAAIFAPKEVVKQDFPKNISNAPWFKFNVAYVIASHPALEQKEDPNDLTKFLKTHSNNNNLANLITRTIPETIEKSNSPCPPDSPVC